MIVLIPPHVNPRERNLIWSMLEIHRLSPELLLFCDAEDLTPTQVQELILVMGSDAPIPEYRAERTEYLLVPLIGKIPGAQSFLNDALGHSVEGGSRIPLWRGGTQPSRAIRNSTSPRPRLRDILIVPRTEPQTALILSFFNKEKAAAA